MRRRAWAGFATAVAAATATAPSPGCCSSRYPSTCSGSCSTPTCPGGRRRRWSCSAFPWCSRSSCWFPASRPAVLAGRLIGTGIAGRAPAAGHRRPGAARSGSMRPGTSPWLAGSVAGDHPAGVCLVVAGSTLLAQAAVLAPYWTRPGGPGRHRRRAGQHLGAAHRDPALTQPLVADPARRTLNRAAARRCRTRCHRGRPSGATGSLPARRLAGLKPAATKPFNLGRRAVQVVHDQVQVQPVLARLDVRHLLEPDDEAVLGRGPAR